MPHPPKPSRTAWQDQQRLLAAGQDSEDLGTAVLLAVFGAGLLGFVGLVIYALSGFFR